MILTGTHLADREPDEGWRSLCGTIGSGFVARTSTFVTTYIEGLNDETLTSGSFYGSTAHTLTGPVIDQSEIFPDLANTTYQDNASDAVHRFV